MKKTQEAQQDQTLSCPTLLKREEQKHTAKIRGTQRDRPHEPACPRKLKREHENVTINATLFQLCSRAYSQTGKHADGKKSDTATDYLIKDVHGERLSVWL